MSTATLPRPLKRRPGNVAGMASVRPGMAVGAWCFEANARDVIGQEYVAGASVEYTTTSGVWEPNPTGRFLNVWGNEFGKVALRDARGERMTIDPGWYAWPDESAVNEPIQGVLL